ncbi:hypothetical protein QX776_07415 [Alteromonadaceae bacterium BrNp21-10]|nr:hypothetical protein [Alteromonadaceae bacterium BrNp21-10]
MNIVKTMHCSTRQQQRAIPNQVLDWLQTFGEEKMAVGGVTRRYFSKRSLKEMKSELGKPIVDLCSKYWAIHLIEAEDGAVITAYWKH